jgi:hypothetical protein
VTASRRKVDYVVARPIVRALAIGLTCISLGSLLALGCAISWLGAARLDPMTLAILSAVALAQFSGGVAGLLAFGWAR